VVEGLVSAVGGLASNGFFTSGRDIELGGNGKAIAVGDRPDGSPVLKIGSEEGFPGGVDIYGTRLAAKGPFHAEGPLFADSGLYAGGFHTDGRSLTLQDRNVLGVGDRSDGSAVLKVNPENDFPGGIDVYGGRTTFVGGLFAESGLTVNGGQTTLRGGLLAEGGLTTTIITITGGADLAEPFQMAITDAIIPGTVLVVDDQNPGKLTISNQPYDTRVAGVVSGAGGIDPGLTLTQHSCRGNCAMLTMVGRAYVLAETSTAPIRAGDLLTTSAIPGYAMKSTDSSRSQGAILGKAMSSLQGGAGLVLVLINLQ
jgi:hypothetical protein